jgi:microcystin-dependent protein
MSDLELPQTIDPDTTADANEVQQNYTAIVAHVNANLVNKFGTVEMENPLVLSGDPTSDDEAANKGYVDAVMPVGAIMMFASNTMPSAEWKLCNGQTLSIATYPKLSALLGNTYGTAPVGSFRLPNFSSRLPIGKATGSTDGRFDTLGHAAGNWQVPMPNHQHTIAHDHGTADTSNEDTNHYHKHVHTHTINHNHPSLAVTTASTQGTHNHAVRTRTGPIPGAGPLETALEGSDVNFNNTGNIANGGTASGAHQHSFTIDLPVTTGLVSAGLSEDMTTGQLDLAGTAAAHHKHSVNVTAAPATVLSGFEDKTITYDANPVTGPDLTSNVEHIPPYLTINFIIKVDPQ